MEDDLQLIEEFESDEWKTFVKREVSRNIKWNVDIEINFRFDNRRPYVDVCCFQATFDIGGTFYTTIINEDISRIRIMGRTLFTNSLIVNFYHQLNKCEKEEKIVEALVRSVQPPKENLFFTIEM